MSVTLLLLAGFVTNTFWSPLSALAQVSVEESKVGTATGVIQNMGFLGAMVGPFIAGTLATGLPISSALIITASVPYLLYTLLVLLYRPPRSVAH